MNKPIPEQSPLYAGVDISKDALDLSLAGESAIRYSRPESRNSSQG
jgi:hypothetical protein